MIKSFQRRCEIKGLPTGFMFFWGPTGHGGDTNDLGRESIQRLMFVCFIPKCDLCFPGLPGDRLYCGLPTAPVCTGRGALNGNKNRGQEGMTLSCCHQHLFLPNPKETDSIILLEGKDHSSPLSRFFLLPVTVKERFTKCRISLWNRDKRETRKLVIVPNRPDNRAGICWASTSVRVLQLQET